MKTRLLLIRHGEAEGNIAHRFHGWFDSDLTPNGREQVALLAERLCGEHIDAVYSSDLKRAYQTARAAADSRGLTIHTDARLREIDGGEWEDVPFAELPERFPEAYANWMSRPYELQIPGGESMRMFQRRLIDAVEDIVQENAGTTVCIATHGTAIRALVCWFYGHPLTRIDDISWYDNASITEVIAEDGRYTVISEGDNAHLGDKTTLNKQDWWKKKE